MARSKNAARHPGRGTELVAKLSARLARLHSVLAEVGDLVDKLERSVTVTRTKLTGENVVAIPCTLETLERAAIEAAFRETGGNYSRSAVILGVDRATLYRRMRDYAEADAALPRARVRPAKKKTRRK